MDGTFYADTEAWFPPMNCYPTWDDVTRFYFSRMSHGKGISSSEVKRELAEFVHEDGCPMAVKNIIIQFETKVLSEYKKYRQGEGRTRQSHKKKERKGVDPVEPSRKSRRLLNVQNPDPAAASLSDSTLYPASVHRPACSASTGSLVVSSPVNEPSSPQSRSQDLRAGGQI